jgi:hypothetical protein
MTDAKRKVTISNAANTGARRRVGGVIASLRQSTTSIILGKLDESSPSDSESSSSGSSGSSSSNSETEDKKGKSIRPSGASRAMEWQTVGAGVHQKRKLLSSAMDNVRTSPTRAKNPAPHGGTTRNRGARATVSKIRSSLIKRRAHPPHNMSNNSGNDSSSSNDSSSKDLVISTKEKSSSNVNADSDSSHSSSSSSSSDSASSNHIAEAFSKPVTSRRKSESSLMGRRKSEALVAPKDSEKALPVHNRAHSLPEAISISEENGESYQPTQKESAPKLRDHRRQQRSARARPSMQNNKSDDRAQSDGA